MVHLSGVALLVIKDTACIELEVLATSVEDSSDWLVSQSHLHHINVARVGEAVVADHGSGGLGGIILAGATLGMEVSSVRVGIGSHGVILLEIVECSAHGTSLASHAAACAINQLLGGEGRESALLHAIGTLNSSAGGCGPIRTAHTLVDHRADHAIVSPVHRVFDVLSVLRFSGGAARALLLGLLLGWLSITEHLLVLLGTEVGELVVADFKVTVCIPAVLLDEVISLLPVVESKLELRLIDV